MLGTGLIAAFAATSDQVPVASGTATALLTTAALVDVHERRLPNPIVAGAAATFVVVLLIEAARGTTIHPTQVVLGSVAMSAPLLALHVLAPASMGFGDVKVAAVLGAAVGAVDWQLTISALALAAGVTAAVGVARRARTIAFGPGLVAGAAIALVCHSVFLPATLDETTHTASTAPSQLGSALR